MGRIQIMVPFVAAPTNIANRILAGPHASCTSPDFKKSFEANVIKLLGEA